MWAVLTRCLWLVEDGSGWERDSQAANWALATETGSWPPWTLPHPQGSGLPWVLPWRSQPSSGGLGWTPASEPGRRRARVLLAVVGSWGEI